MITRFILNKEQLTLDVETSQQALWHFSYEYLRVLSPNQQAMKPSLIANKKQVKLVSIESAGQHGYRLIFDDNHHSIFTDEEFFTLHQYQQKNWQHYLTQLTEQKLTREASINITQL